MEHQGRAEHTGMPWRVLVALVPVIAVLTIVACIVGFGAGRAAGTRHVQQDLATSSPTGSSKPVASPKTGPPEPFVSSMPRPTQTALRSNPTPRQIVGPQLDVGEPTSTLSPNLPFSFRVPKGAWKQRTPYPQRDMAYATAYATPEGNEAASDSPLFTAFAWRACGACSFADVAAFDARFRNHHGAPKFDPKKDGRDTAYDERTEGGRYYLMVRHVYDGPDGNRYLVDYLTRAPEQDKMAAQRVANEILTQMG